jgi:hypothetical protein
MVSMYRLGQVGCIGEAEEASTRRVRMSPESNAVAEHWLEEHRTFKGGGVINLVEADR